MVQELRDAVAEFGRCGKLTVAWSETFGDFSAGNLPYYLATAFRRIVLQPSGDVGLTGIAVEQVFLRSAMDRLGVDVQVAKRREYKSAADMVTERGFTGPAREATERLTSSISGQLTAAIAARLGIGEAEARTLIDRGPFLAAEALELGLVDALGYRDEVYGWLRKRAGREAVLQYVGRYQRSHTLASRVRKLPRPREQFVALVHATGPIRSGRSSRGPLSSAMGSDTVAGALRAAAGDDRAKAILLRVDSPGGSYVASDTIWREVVRARAAGKPVVVSMGDLAASGGYFISMAADVIVAQPGTLTGSIGVIFMHFNVRPLLETVKVEETTLKTGKYKDTFSPFRAITEQDREEVQGISDDVYSQFIRAVAEGRGLKEDEVRKMADGRIYTGRRAKELHLIDELGGFQEAVAKAWQLAEQTGEPRMQMPPKDVNVSLRDLMRGAFEGAAAGVSNGVRGAAHSGLQLIAPQLVE
jgi:protease-4